MHRLRRLVLSTAFGPLAAGCANHGAPSGDAVSQSAPVVAAADQRSGAQLWADNCSRCHYARPPQSFSETQWEVIVHHMRLRANLTGAEARAITDFLKASD